MSLAVENLRKLWEKKKQTEGITQIEAAKELGWTQGAFSHYLSNITTLNNSAVSKLADFLEVAPTQIDPDFWQEGATQLIEFPMNPTTLLGKPVPEDFHRLEMANPVWFIQHGMRAMIVDSNDFGPFYEGMLILVIDTKALLSKEIDCLALKNFKKVHERQGFITLTKKKKTSKFSVNYPSYNEWIESKDLKTFHTHLTVMAAVL